MFTSILSILFLHLMCNMHITSIRYAYMWLCLDVYPLILSRKPQKPLKPAVQCPSKPPSAFPLWQPTSGHITHHTDALQYQKHNAHQVVQIDAPQAWLICEVGCSLHAHMLLFSPSCYSARYQITERVTCSFEIFESGRTSWPLDLPEHRQGAPLPPSSPRLLITQWSHWSRSGHPDDQLATKKGLSSQRAAQPAPSGAKP